MLENTEDMKVIETLETAEVEEDEEPKIMENDKLEQLDSADDKTEEELSEKEIERLLLEENDDDDEELAGPKSPSSKSSGKANAMDDDEVSAETLTEVDDELYNDNDLEILSETNESKSHEEKSVPKKELKNATDALSSSSSTTAEINKDDDDDDDEVGIVALEIKVTTKSYQGCHDDDNKPDLKNKPKEEVQKVKENGEKLNTDDTKEGKSEPKAVKEPVQEEEVTEIEKKVDSAEPMEEDKSVDPESDKKKEIEEVVGVVEGSDKEDEEKPNYSDALSELTSISQTARKILDEDSSSKSDSITTTANNKRSLESEEEDEELEEAKKPRVSSPVEEENEQKGQKKAMKKFKKELKRMTRSDLESLVLKKMVAFMCSQSELGELRQKCDLYDEMNEKWKRKVQALQKQCQDLNTVMRKYITDSQNKPKDRVAPVRITRSVGLQVQMHSSAVDRRRINSQQQQQRGGRPSPQQQQQQHLHLQPPQHQPPQQPRKIIQQKTPTVSPANNNKTGVPITPKQVIANNNKIPNSASLAAKTILNGNHQGISVSRALVPLPATVATATAAMSTNTTTSTATANDKRNVIDIVDLSDDEDEKEKEKRVVPPMRVVTNGQIPPNGPRTYAVVSRGGGGGVVSVPTPNTRVLTVNAPGSYIMQGSALVPVSAPPPSAIRPNMTAIRQAIGNGNVRPVFTSTARPRMYRTTISGHPAPLPEYQNPPHTLEASRKSIPPKPSLKISRLKSGIVLSWNLDLKPEHATISNYQLFAYQESSSPPTSALWKKVGDVKALPLPMACTLTQFMKGNKYHFAVRASDAHARVGPFSDPSSIVLT